MTEYTMNSLLTVALAEEAATGTTETVVADNAVQSEPTESAAGGSISSIIVMVVMVVAFYFLLIRPQRKKDKAVKNMLDALKVGDRICTIGGIYGTITAIKNDTVTLSMGGQQNPVVIARWAIRSVEDAVTENDAELTN